jgi:hypothetical protein
MCIWEGGGVKDTKGVTDTTADTDVAGLAGGARGEDDAEGETKESSAPSADALSGEAGVKALSPTSLPPASSVLDAAIPPTGSSGGGRGEEEGEFGDMGDFENMIQVGRMLHSLFDTKSHKCTFTRLNST